MLVPEYETEIIMTYEGRTKIVTLQTLTIIIGANCIIQIPKSILKLPETISLEQDN